MPLFRYSFKSYCSAGSCWKSLRKLKSQFPILSGNNKTTTLLQLFEIEKNSWQTFRITYFFHEVYKRKLEHVPTSRVPIFWRFVVFTHRRSPYVTLPLTKYHSKTEVEQERLVCLWFLKEEFVVFCNIEKILKYYINILNCV